MSYGMSVALQGAVFNALITDVALGGLVGTAVYDAVPSGNLPDTYVRLGAETAKAAGDGSGHGALHQFTISVITALPGFATAKAVAVAVNDALHEADLALGRGSLVLLRFEKATARSIEGGTTRQIDLRFVARVQDD